MKPFRRISIAALAYGTVVWFSTTAMAQETTTYTYDAKGRVTNVTRSGGPSNGVAASYSYDAADNRSNVTVTNSPNGSGSGAGGGATAPTYSLVVLPLNGLSVVVFAK